MIKEIRASYYHNFKNAQYCALHDDPIPDYLKNGDQVYFIDTGKKYIYDEIAGRLFEEPSVGLISGGLENQVLVKNSDDNYDVTWKTIAAVSTVEFETDNNGILNVIATSI